MSETLAPLPEDFRVLLERLVSIGGPTGEERARADFIAGWLERAGGGKRVWRDGTGNVWLDLSGGSGGCRLLDAHIDTVFSDGSPPLRKEGETWHAPGILDNTAACALLLVLARELLRDAEKRPLILSFTVGEEGEGDLCGIRRLTETLGERLRDAVILESGLNRCTHEAVGSLRYRIEFRTPGGHSWGDFGKTSALHEMARLVGVFRDLLPWRPGRTTMNVGSIHGGATINTIAPRAVGTFDFRSVRPEDLDRIREAIPRLVGEFEESATELSGEATIIGRRPAGSIPENHPLVREAVSHQKTLGIKPDFRAGSTNANATLAAGIPSVCIGVAEGGGTHTREEFLRLDSVPAGWTYLRRFARAG